MGGIVCLMIFYWEDRPNNYQEDGSDLPDRRSFKIEKGRSGDSVYTISTEIDTIYEKFDIDKKDSLVEK